MRQRIREAQREAFERIAVVCGAWHLGALRPTHRPKPIKLASRPCRAESTVHLGAMDLRHLTRASGYGAGIHSPAGTSTCGAAMTPRNPAPWLAGPVARLMRERDLDCSSAH